MTRPQATDANTPDLVSRRKKSQSEVGFLRRTVQEMERRRRTERDGRGGYRLDDARWTSVRREFRPGRCSREQRGEDAVFVMAAAQGKTRKRKPVSSFGPWRVWKGDRERDEPRGNVEYDLSSRERKADPVRKRASPFGAQSCARRRTCSLTAFRSPKTTHPPKSPATNVSIPLCTHTILVSSIGRGRVGGERGEEEGDRPRSFPPLTRFWKSSAVL